MSLRTCVFCFYYSPRRYELIGIFPVLFKKNPFPATPWTFFRNMKPDRFLLSAKYSWLSVLRKQLAHSYIRLTLHGSIHRLDLTFFYLISMPAGEKVEKKESPSSQNDAQVDVSCLDLRVGRITSAMLSPETNGLYVEQVDVGEASPRTVVSDLAKHIPLDQVHYDTAAVLFVKLHPKFHESFHYQIYGVPVFVWLDPNITPRPSVHLSSEHRQRLPPTALMKAFPHDFGRWLQGFAPIQPQELRWAQMLILGDGARLAVIVPAHPKCAAEDWGQGCVQAGSLRTGTLHVETGKSPP